MSTAPSRSSRSPRGDLVTDLVEEIFSVGAALMRAGDHIAAQAGLTAAAWQVLGLLDDGPATVAALSRRRGLRRQGVQQIVNRLAAHEAVRSDPNPDDRRAPLITLTAHGHDLLDRLATPQADWSESLSRHLSSDQRIDDALDLLRSLRSLVETPPPDPTPVTRRPGQNVPGSPSRRRTSTGEV